MLDGVSVRVDAGECVALVGANGSGKSSLLGVMGGVIEASGGSVERTGGCDMVFQTTAVDRFLTARENLVLHARLRGRPRRDAHDFADRGLNWAGLGGRGRDRAGRLSGGMQRRLDLARVMVEPPAIVLLDEPATGLDADGRGLLDEAIGRSAAAGCAVALSTHDFEQAGRADRVVLMDGGRIVREGRPDELIAALGAWTLMRTGADGERVRTHDSRDRLEPLRVEAEHAGATYTLGPTTLGEVYADAVRCEPKGVGS